MKWDAIIIGAGAAGLFCAGIAGQRGLRILLIDHADKVAEKIRISGGGRCNFTNCEVTSANFLSSNPEFSRSALARYGVADFIALVRRYGVAFHEKHKGQLFCDRSSGQIIELLLGECEAGHVTRWQPCKVQALRHCTAGYQLDTNRGTVSASNVVIATGGLSIPKLGATDFGYRIARQFHHRVIDPRPALVPLVFEARDWARFAALAGVSIEAVVENDCDKPKNRGRFTDSLLFTHRGLSGPAALQISSFWRPGETLAIDLAAGQHLAAALQMAKTTSKRQLTNELAIHLPSRLADAWLARSGMDPNTPLPQVPNSELERLAQSLQAWRLIPNGTEGWRKAEVTAGGIDTRELNSQSMASRRQPGLHFIGEVLDVTGWLGGYNFQWAWASAAACARALNVPGRT